MAVLAGRLLEAAAAEGTSRGTSLGGTASGNRLRQKSVDVHARAPSRSEWPAAMSRDFLQKARKLFYREPGLANQRPEGSFG